MQREQPRFQTTQSCGEKSNFLHSCVIKYLGVAWELGYIGSRSCNERGSTSPLRILNSRRWKKAIFQSLVRYSLVPRPHPQGENLVTFG